MLNIHTADDVPEDEVFEDAEAPADEYDEDDDFDDDESDERFEGVSSHTLDPHRILPRPTPEERQQLRESIKAEGLQTPIILDAAGNIIDGYERRDICDELGIDWQKSLIEWRTGLNDAQCKALHIRSNLCRRSVVLSEQQKNELIETYLTANSTLSDATIAAVFKVHRTTVQRRRKRMEESGKLKPAETVVGRDKKIRKRKQATVITKNRGEFDKLKEVLPEADGKIRGLVRANSVVSKVKAKRLQDKVDSNSGDFWPSSIDIRCSDFRNLDIEPDSVDLILTDVVWSEKAADDWKALGELSQKWLKPNGLFVSIIGNQSLMDFGAALTPFLKYQMTISMTYAGTRVNFVRSITERWRPIVVFAKSNELIVRGIDDTVDADPEEKEFHKWQQPLSVAQRLLIRLTKPDFVVLDPQVGTGTNAVAAARWGCLKFIGCDIDPEQVKRTRYRLDTEVTPLDIETPSVAECRSRLPLIYSVIRERRRTDRRRCDIQP